MAEEKKMKSKPKIVEIEEQILAFWNKEEIFKKSLEKKGKEFVFYDGPPFANGYPHYGHMLASFIKDSIPRYKTMQGFHIDRRWGWDCHGLPVENLVEKELNLKSKKDIQDYGLEKFNAVAKESVLRYTGIWKEIIPRIGRWVDMENDYRTMDSNYTESVWWIFKTLFDKGLIYEGFKSMQICPHCGTTLSNFEVNQGYKDITDISVFVNFELVDKPKTYFLAWTTTPWTLPGNVALAVGSEIDYAQVEFDGFSYILAKDLVLNIFGSKKYEIKSVVKGSKLVGISYKPIFSYYNTKATKNIENGFKVYAADFVTITDGTGIVHIAPAFGEDDMKLGEREKLPFVQHVGMDGKFKNEVIDFALQEVKPKDDHQKADIEIIKWLAPRGLLFEKKKIVHSYPHCWRCDTPLLNYATSSWFVRVTDLKDQLITENKKVSWVPADIRLGRFGKWLEGARDWAISRSRFWGAPIPVWRGIESGKIYPIGTIDDLSKIIKKSGNTYTLMRHGEAENNVLKILNFDDISKYHLTENGRVEAYNQAKKIAQKGADIIISSDFLRTKETARIIAEECNLDAKDIVYDVRLREYKTGLETIASLKKRVFEFMYDIDNKYSNKKIVIVSHGLPLNTIFNNVTGDTTKKDYFETTATSLDFDFVRLPHNNDFDLDLHRPYIDNIECVSEYGEKLVRVPEVFDCWFESGAMPYGKAGYIGKPTDIFDPKGGILKKKIGFPADFIAEGVDQTRGWFYSMIVLGVALFGRTPYENVIVNGTILAENGEKMSKRLKNYPDPVEVVNKYGADSLRYYLLSSPVVSAQDLCFVEKGVDEVYKKLVQKLDNVLSFFELYALKNEEEIKYPKSNNVLDKWILEYLQAVINETTKWLELYQLDKASRPLMSFVEDLSTWYIRRSRDRFKSDDLGDKKDALETTRYVLGEFAKISAPFLPFYAEYLFGRIKGKNNKESVHLESWPKTKEGDKEIIENMMEVRKLVTLGLEQRSKAGVKVRQPLANLSLKNSKLESDLLGLIKDEVNVKNILVDEKIENEVLLDTNITEDLRKEGIIRDLMRAIQDLRKTEGLTVSDKIELILDSDEKGKELVNVFLKEIKKVTLITGISYGILSHKEELIIEGYRFKIDFKK